MDCSYVKGLTMTPSCHDLDMGQGDVLPLGERIGYALKRVDVALRAALDVALREHGLTLAQYAALELLAEAPGRSIADLARGAFVTRQAMHGVLGNLLAAGLVAQRPSPEGGRAVGLTLTSAGEERLRGAARAALLVEERMAAGLATEARRRLLADLDACVRALGGRNG
jgi:DNA-binding MarR family transcriptional regulator